MSAEDNTSRVCQRVLAESLADSVRKGETPRDNQILFNLPFYMGFYTENAPQITDHTTKSTIGQESARFFSKSLWVYTG
jgi:hypothetical protein